MRNINFRNYFLKTILLISNNKNIAVFKIAYQGPGDVLNVLYRLSFSKPHGSFIFSVYG